MIKVFKSQFGEILVNLLKIEFRAKQGYPRPPERCSRRPILLWPTSLSPGLPLIIEKLKIKVVEKVRI